MSQASISLVSIGIIHYFHCQLTPCLAMLEQARQEVLHAIAYSIEDTIASVGGLTPIRNGHDTTTCAFVHEVAPSRSQHLLGKLAKDRLWPTNYFRWGDPGSAATILGKMKCFQISFFDTNEECSCSKCYDHPLLNGREVSSNFMTEAMDIEKFRYGWICLECAISEALPHNTKCGHESTKPQTD